MRQSTHKIYEDLLARYPALCSCDDEILNAIELLIFAFQSGNKLLACGNGGSAADSEHIVGELMKAFKLPRHLNAETQGKMRLLFPEEADGMIRNLQGAVPAISLVSQVALMTAFSNDQSAQYVFAQQVMSYGQPGDVLLAISTSGNSENILHAARAAKLREVRVIGLTGYSGGKLKALSDIAICVPFSATYQIQEYHLPVYHCLCACVENEIFGEE